jgi:hypothetical protein
MNLKKSASDEVMEIRIINERVLLIEEVIKKLANRTIASTSDTVKGIWCLLSIESVLVFIMESMTT